LMWGKGRQGRKVIQDGVGRMLTFLLPLPLENCFKIYNEGDSIFGNGRDGGGESK